MLRDDRMLRGRPDRCSPCDARPWTEAIYEQKILSLEKQGDQILEAQLRMREHHRAVGDRRHDDVMHLYRALQGKLCELAIKFDECFETCDEALVVEELRHELYLLRDQVVHDGNMANGDMDAIKGGFDEIREELRLVYSDMDALDQELRVHLSKVENMSQYAEHVAERTQEALEKSAKRIGEEWKFVREGLASTYPPTALLDLERKFATTQLDLHSRLGRLEACDATRDVACDSAEEHKEAK